jgi:hypothetical protein
MKDLPALEEVEANDFALFKHHMLQATSSEIDQAEVAVFEATVQELGLLPVAVHQLAALKGDLFEDAPFQTFSFQIE